MQHEKLACNIIARGALFIVIPAGTLRFGYCMILWWWNVIHFTSSIWLELGSMTSNPSHICNCVAVVWVLSCVLFCLWKGFDLLTSHFHVSFLYSVTIESTGALPPETLFTEAVKILEDKCERVITELSWSLVLQEIEKWASDYRPRSCSLNACFLTHILVYKYEIGFACVSKKYECFRQNIAFNFVSW